MYLSEMLWAMSVQEQATAVEYLRRLMAQHRHDWAERGKGCRLCDEVNDFIDQVIPVAVQPERSGRSAG